MREVLVAGRRGRLQKVRDSLSKISASKTKDATAKAALVSVSAENASQLSCPHQIMRTERSLLLHSRKSSPIGRAPKKYGPRAPNRPQHPFYFLGARRSPPTQYPPSPTMFPPRPCASFRPENIASRPIRIARAGGAHGPSPRLTPSDTRATSTCAAASPPLYKILTLLAPACHRRFEPRAGHSRSTGRRRRSSAADGRSTSPSRQRCAMPGQPACTRLP